MHHEFIVDWEACGKVSFKASIPVISIVAKTYGHISGTSQKSVFVEFVVALWPYGILLWWWQHMKDSD